MAQKRVTNRDLLDMLRVVEDRYIRIDHGLETIARELRRLTGLFNKEFARRHADEDE